MEWQEKAKIKRSSLIEEYRDGAGIKDEDVDTKILSLKMKLKIYKMAISILPKFLTLKWNISRTIWRIEVGNGSFFSIFHALSFELNFFFDRRCPLIGFRFLPLESLSESPAFKS